MSRLGAALIKKHLAAVVGSRPVVVAAEPEQPPPQVEEPVPSARDARESPPPVPQDGGMVPNGEAPSPVTEPEDPRVAAALEVARQQALALYEEARQRGEREGWEAGFAAGQEAARAQVQQEAEETMHAALALLEDARRERVMILRQARQDVVRMALDLAARILEREVSLSPEVVREQAAILLRRLEQGEKATLHVHPDDVAVIQPWLPELARACGANLEVAADPAVGRGGVMVETPHGYLDGRLDRQLRRLGEALLAWTGSLPEPAEAQKESPLPAPPEAGRERPLPGPAETEPAEGEEGREVTGRGGEHHGQHGQDVG
ncbi:MAG: FliH/SctL family protein [Bacillota bacterium]|nr:FliH/SctL family protein [Bacillota bacterium]MDI7248797.1 FliH/SctL family protein [Bacillota bacterium]